MSTLPINNLEITPLVGSKTTENALLSEITTNNTKASTAKILSFPQKPLHFSVQSMKYLPSDTEAARNILIEQILTPENYSSNTEKISKQAIDREIKQKLIEKSLGEAMRIVARSDAENGIFGDVYIKNGDNKHITGYVAEFGRGLRAGLAKLNNGDMDSCDAVGQVFREMQFLLLKNYGTLVTKERCNYATNEDLESAISVLKIKENYWKGKLSQLVERKEMSGKRESNQVNKNRVIPEKYEMSITLLIDTFVKNYVNTVWETESAMRHAMETEVIKSA